MSGDDSWRVCWKIVGIKLLKSKKGRRLEVKWRAWSLSETRYLDTWKQGTLTAREDRREDG